MSSERCLVFFSTFSPKKNGYLCQGTSVHGWRSKFFGARVVTSVVLHRNMAAKQLNPFFVTLCLCLNLCCSIIIVLINKWIYTYYGFPNMTMTCIHFIFTTVGLILCQQLNTFQPKRLPIDKMLPLSLTFCGFVVLTNLSLQTNSVGTYQIAKTMTTPCIIFIQSQFYGRRFSRKVKLTLVSNLETMLQCVTMSGN